MDRRQRIINVEMFAKSGAAKVALMAELKRRDDANMADPSDAECQEICDRADALNVYGFDAKQDRSGNWIQQGIGTWPDRVTGNHFAAIRRYEGQQAYEAAVRKLWKEAPDRAQKIGLPRVGA